MLLGNQGFSGSEGLREFNTVVDALNTAFNSIQGTNRRLISSKI